MISQEIDYSPKSYTNKVGNRAVASNKQEDLESGKAPSSELDKKGTVGVKVVAKRTIFLSLCESCNSKVSDGGTTNVMMHNTEVDPVDWRTEEQRKECRRCNSYIRNMKRSSSNLQIMKM
jgi:hypothetical protein